MTFTSTSTDPEGLPLTTSWDLDNNGTFETPAPPRRSSTRFPAAYPFKLKVVDASGARTSRPARSRSRTARRPRASTTAQEPANRTADHLHGDRRRPGEPHQGAHLGRRQRRRSSTTAPARRSRGPSRSRARYTVKFKVEDLDGASTVVEDTVAVGNQPPKADVRGAPRVADRRPDRDARLDRARPRHPARQVAVGPERRQRLRGRGDAEGPEVKYTFPAAGTYTVGLRGARQRGRRRTS